MSHIVQIPFSIKSDHQGYQKLIAICNHVLNSRYEDLQVSFAGVRWFEANLCAALGAAIFTKQENGGSVSLSNCSDYYKGLFRRNGFSRLFGDATYDLLNDTTIKFTIHQPNDTQQISDYINRRLVEKRDFPNLSKVLKNKISQSFFEVYENAIFHSDCNEIFSCGQFYPRKNPPRIDFTVVDLGRTIKANVAEHLKVKISGWEAVRWAVMENNTTKTGSIPGGLGLKLIEEFVELNNGKIQIVSADGYWELRRGKRLAMPMRNSFPGTIVNFEINLDNNFYYDDSEEDDHDFVF